MRRQYLKRESLIISWNLWETNPQIQKVQLNIRHTQDTEHPSLVWHHRHLRQKDPRTSQTNKMHLPKRKHCYTDSWFININKEARIIASKYRRKKWPTYFLTESIFWNRDKVKMCLDTSKQTLSPADLH